MFKIHKFARSRPHLTIAMVVGIAITPMLPSDWAMVTRVLIAWNVAVWFYLCSMGWLMMRASHTLVRKTAEQEDKSAAVVLVILSVAAVFSLVAIVLELAASKELSTGLRLVSYALTGLTVLGSWFLVGTLFTFHYAHTFYRAPAGQRPLRFPDEEQNPNYWDFLYFSFTIAVAVQTSDVIVMTRSMRKMVLAQSILSFLFNSAILGLSINIAAGLVGS